MGHNCCVTIDPPAIARFPRSAIPVWAIAAIGAVVVGVIAPASRSLAFLPIVLYTAIMATFIVQLAIDQKIGFVTRVMISLGGAIVILTLATAVLAVR
jgi:hypothetical protein